MDLRKTEFLHGKTGGDSSLPLMEFLINMRPDSKRGDIKKWMKYGHLKLNGTVTKAFDAEVKPVLS